MITKILTYLFALAVLVSIVGCSSSDEREVINQQYVDSDEYDDFSQEAGREQQAAQQRKIGTEEQLKNIAECSAPRTLTAPFKIDSTTITQWKEGSNSDCFEDNSFDELPYALEIVGGTPLQDTEVKWVLRSQKSMYRHQDLLVATFRDQELQKTETVAQYRKNLEENITTDLQVSTQEGKLIIATVEHRQIKYPIEQDNSIRMAYSIDNKGIIADQ